MAGEDLLESGGDSSSDTAATGKDKKHKPLSKGQKIGVAIGVITILLVIWQIKKSQASSATTGTTTTPIDPQTGYPEGSAEDQAALAQIANAGSYGNQGIGSQAYPDTGTTTTSSGVDPSTGLSYSAEIASNASGIGTLQSEFQQIQTSLTSLTSDVQGLSTTSTQGPSPSGTWIPPAITPVAPVQPTSPTASKFPPLSTLLARVTTTEQDIAAAKKGVATTSGAEKQAWQAKLTSAQNTLVTQKATLTKAQAAA